MVTFRNNSNNSRRSSFRRTDRNYKSNGDRQKFSSNFSNNDNFKRKSPGRNNHNAPKLIEKYNDLAREASSNGDKIFENYLQHADHFITVLNERQNYKRETLDGKTYDEVEISLQSSDGNDVSKNNLDENSDKVTNAHPNTDAN